MDCDAIGREHNSIAKVNSCVTTCRRHHTRKQDKPSCEPTTSWTVASSLKLENKRETCGSGRKGFPKQWDACQHSLSQFVRGDFAGEIFGIGLQRMEGCTVNREFSDIQDDHKTFCCWRSEWCDRTSIAFSNFFFLTSRKKICNYDSDHFIKWSELSIRAYFRQINIFSVIPRLQPTRLYGNIGVIPGYTACCGSVTSD